MNAIVCWRRRSQPSPRPRSTAGCRHPVYKAPNSFFPTLTAPLAPRATVFAAGLRSLRRRGVLGALHLAPAPDRSGDEHNDDAEDSKHHLAAVPAIGELRRHAERFEES